ncbi:acyl-CoA N-acyltransferase [Podospora appendiculata]|uniref:Acyl-CoA N-acyltransferase n=1 Tax=Podospora appendiculata TaxID=314037 RepID=A0AAE0XLM0_9PEZI|nr:acyl-CoA N-acyltransferase [Podospora appendiculata]
MAWKLRPAVDADGLAIGRIGREAFLESGFGRILFTPRSDDEEPADPEEEIQWRRRRAIRRMNEGIPTLVVVDEAPGDNGEETVLGFAQWERPATSLPPVAAGAVPQASIATEGQKADDPPKSLNLDKMQHMFKVFDEEIEKVLGPDGHKNMWYLMLLAVDPKYQGRGVGKTLLRWGMDQAAAEGKKTFLLATVEGRPLYEKQGFRVLSDFEVYGTVNYAMLLGDL